MPHATRAVVFGGYGTFGSLVCRDLARRNVPLVIVGRDAARAEAFARQLGADHRAADAADLGACHRILSTKTIAVSCAGPFAALGTALLEACVEQGAHYVDIADERAHARRVRAFGPRFAARSLVAVTGCSSLPAISGALALHVSKTRPDPPERARVTLFIGNRNPKGEAAVRSAISVLGRPFPAPQGTLRGFRGREVVRLPSPFGSRAVYDFESPEYDLFPELLQVRSVSVKVGFELRIATLGFATLAALPFPWGAKAARLLRSVSGLVPPSGRSGGAVLAELGWPDGTWRGAALSGSEDGQRMAALPCTLAVEALFRGEHQGTGIVHPWELLPRMVEQIAKEGFSIATS